MLIQNASTGSQSLLFWTAHRKEMTPFPVHMCSFFIAISACWHIFTLTHAHTLTMPMVKQNKNFLLWSTEHMTWENKRSKLTSSFLHFTCRDWNAHAQSHSTLHAHTHTRTSSHKGPPRDVVKVWMFRVQDIFIDLFLTLMMPEL